MPLVPDIETMYLLDRFKDLYDQAIDVREVKPFDCSEYRAFKHYTGSPIKLVYSKTHMDLFPNFPPFFKFYGENDHFWMIPCEIPTKDPNKNKIFGFVLRAFSDSGTRKYMNFHVGDTFPLIFGLQDFRDFKLGSPIVLNEGVKDNLFVKQYYKYSISCLTNSININVLNMLMNITENFVVAFDTDSRGAKGSKKLIKIIQKNGGSATPMYTTYSVKDWGEFFDVGMNEETLKDHMKSMLIFSNCTPTC